MKTVLTILASLMLVSTAFAQWGDFDNTPYAPGFYVQAYPSFSTASSVYDSEGESWDYVDSWTSFAFAARPSYYGMMNENRWMVSAVLPVVSYSPPVGESETGISDIQLSAAYWIIDEHQTGTYLSAWLWTDIPTGDDAKGLGTGQLNLRPGIAFTKEAPQYRLQASAYYNLRLENSDLNWKPGDELWANVGFGYAVNPQFMPGLEIQTGWGQDSKFNDVTWPDSKTQWLRLGPYFEYQLNPQLGFQLGGLYNVMGKNSQASLDIQGRVTWSIQ